MFALTLVWPQAAMAKKSSAQLLELLRKKPAGLNKDAWRAQRREAARELGRLRERRAVPALLQIVRRERFDVILEIAIDALGNIRDRRAAEPLKKLLHDPSLDAYVRDAVASALKKIGAGRKTAPRRPRRPRRPKQPQTPTEPIQEPVGSHNRYLFGALPKLKLELPDDDVLAKASVLELAGSTGEFSWDSGSERTTASLALATRYRLQIERTKLGLTIDGSGQLGFGLDNPPGDDNTAWLFDHALQLNPELRYYPFQNDAAKLFGQITAGIGYGMIVASPANSLENRVDFAARLSVAVAPGWGRILDIGPRLRLRRVERVLRRAGLLEGNAIDEATGRALMQLWYQLRNTIGTYAQLGYTLRILEGAGALGAKVDPATAYRLVRILDDPQLIGRRDGLMARLGYGYARTLVKDLGDDDLGFLFGDVEYLRQVGTTRELGGRLSFYWSHLGSPDTYNVSFRSFYHWYLYNRAFDPLGAIGATVEAGISNQPGSGFSDGGVGWQVLAGGSYTRLFTRGTRLSGTLQVGGGRRGAIVLVSLEARYGVAAGAFVAH